MVFMGAGNFENGDSSVFGPEKLMDKNIVLVTFNHRIGVLGWKLSIYSPYLLFLTQDLVVKRDIK